MLLFYYLSVFFENVFLFHIPFILSYLDSQICTLHENAFPSRTKYFGTFSFRETTQTFVSTKISHLPLSFPLFHHPFSSPTMMLKNEGRIENNKTRERKERGKKNRRRGWGWKANLCDWGWWGPDKVSAHLFTPGGRRRFFKRQQLQSSISEESWMPKRKTAVIVVWFLQNGGDLFLEKRSKYFFFYFAIHSLWKVFISEPKICSPRLQFRFFPAHLTPVLKQFIR